jgi:tRNA-dihydrouridine synthase B
MRPAYNLARGAQVIDINMGCPAKKVCRKRGGLGAAADRSAWSPIYCNAVVAAVDAPVTLKIRTGVDPAAPQWADDSAHRRGRGYRSAVGTRSHTRLRLQRRSVEHDTTAQDRRKRRHTGPRQRRYPQRR